MPCRIDFQGAFERHFQEETQLLAALITLQDNKKNLLADLKNLRPYLNSRELRLRDEMISAVGDARARRRDMEMLTLQVG